MIEIKQKRENFLLMLHLQTSSSWMPYRGPILRSLWVGGRQRMMWRLAFTRVIKNFIGSAKKLENFFLIAGIKAWQNETNTQAATVNFLLSRNMKMRNPLLFYRVKICFPNDVSLVVTVLVLKKHTIIRCSFNREVTKNQYTLQATKTNQPTNNIKKDKCRNILLITYYL